MNLKFSAVQDLKFTEDPVWLAKFPRKELVKQSWKTPQTNHASRASEQVGKVVLGCLWPFPPELEPFHKV